MYNEYADPVWQYGASYGTSVEDSVLGFLIAFCSLFILLGLIIGILIIVVNWKLFKKAGERGWKYLIPFYGNWVRIRIALGRNSIGWFIISLIPVVNLLFYYYINFYFAKRFSGKDSIGLLYLLLPTVVGILMAFSNRYEYISNRSPEDSGRGGLDGDWPLWAMDEEKVEEAPTSESRYDSRFN